MPFSTRLRSDDGARATLEKFFELCDAAGPACAFGPGSETRYAALADQLRAAPVPVTDPETGEEFLLTYADLVGITLGALYDAFSFPSLGEFLADVEAAASPAAVGRSLARLASVNALISKRGFPHYPNFVEAFPAVACEDGNNPDDHAVWSQQGAAADAAFGYFGRPWTWASSSCASWRLEDLDRYVGPFDRHTANPVLVIGNLYDPATRYQGAQLVAGLLPDSALLTVDVPGHTSLGASPCAGDLTGAYLLDPAEAATIDGVVCPPEIDFFEGAAAATSGARATPAPAHAGRRGSPLTGIAAHWTGEQPRTQPRRDRLRAGRRVRGRGDRPATGAPGWPAGDAGPAHPALAGAVAGRRLVLRRPLRARCRRGHRRDVGRAAPAHRAADRELALHRRDRAPRQRRAPRDGPSRRAEPDDRRPRHQPLRGVPARHDHAARRPAVGGAARRRAARRPGLRALRTRPRLGRGLGGPGVPRCAAGRGVAGRDRDAVARRRAAAGRRRDAHARRGPDLRARAAGRHRSGLRGGCRGRAQRARVRRAGPRPAGAARRRASQARAPRRSAVRRADHDVVELRGPHPRGDRRLPRGVAGADLARRQPSSATARTWPRDGSGWCSATTCRRSRPPRCPRSGSARGG